MTSFQLVGLSLAAFTPLFDLSDIQLAERGARRVAAAKYPGYPCRVSLRDAEVGEASGTCRAFVEVGDECGTTTAQSQCEYICDPGEMVCIAPMDAGPLACALTLQL